MENVPNIIIKNVVRDNGARSVSLFLNCFLKQCYLYLTVALAAEFKGDLDIYGVFPKALDTRCTPRKLLISGKGRAQRKILLHTRLFRRTQNNTKENNQVPIVSSRPL